MRVVMMGGGAQPVDEGRIHFSSALTKLHHRVGQCSLHGIHLGTTEGIVQREDDLAFQLLRVQKAVVATTGFEAFGGSVRVPAATSPSKFTVTEGKSLTLSAATSRCNRSVKAVRNASLLSIQMVPDTGGSVWVRAIPDESTATTTNTRGIAIKLIRKAGVNAVRGTAAPGNGSKIT